MQGPYPDNNNKKKKKNSALNINTIRALQHADDITFKVHELYSIPYCGYTEMMYSMQVLQQNCCTHAVFDDSHLSIATNRHVYGACVLSVLLYGSECWVPLKKHHRSFKTILVISKIHQWQERIKSAVVREQWGDKETMETKLKHCRLEWLGRLSRMPDYRFPNICLFGWFSHSCPFCGPKRQWRDLIKGELKSVGMSDGCWCCQIQDGEKWRSVWSQSVKIPNKPAKNVVCHVCIRRFRRECDKTCHKCTVKRSRAGWCCAVSTL